MSTLEQKQNQNVLEETRGIKNIALETEAKLAQSQAALEACTETATLSPEAKKSYQKRGAALFEKYSTHARKLVQIAAVATVINAAPAFAQTQSTETLEQPAVATQADETENTVLQDDDTPEDFSGTTPQEAFQLSEKVEVLLDRPLGALEEVDLPNPATTSSIIANALESAVNDKLEGVKKDPLTAGAGLISKFAKGPLKSLADVIDVARSIQKSAERGESPKETAQAVGRLLLNIKTLGLGGLVLDFLQAQTPPDKENSTREE